MISGYIVIKLKMDPSNYPGGIFWSTSIPQTCVWLRMTLTVTHVTKLNFSTSIHTQSRNTRKMMGWIQTECRQWGGGEEGNGSRGLMAHAQTIVMNRVSSGWVTLWHISLLVASSMQDPQEPDCAEWPTMLLSYEVLWVSSCPILLHLLELTLFQGCKGLDPTTDQAYGKSQQPRASTC